VVDAAAPERLDEARAVLERALASPDLAGAPLLILTNKRDISGTPGCGAAVAALGASAQESGGSDRAVRVFGTCALSGEGLREALDWAVEAARKARRTKWLADRAAAQAERG
jgi:signal recognition particle receptor subunit beta